jgi:enoyl-CoA hydratase/carnithine racemase
MPEGMRLVELRDSIAGIVLDRPARANAIDSRMHTRLATVWDDLAAQPWVRAVVLSGTGKAFCSGGDRSGWTSMIKDERVRSQKMTEAIAIVLRMLACPLPLVAAVNGPAVGLGCTLAACCDFIVMSNEAFFSDPHVTVGLAAGDGGAALLPELLPLPVARQMLYTGKPLGAAQAMQLGLAAAVVPREEVVDTATDIAADLARLPADAYRGTKRAVNSTLIDKISPALTLASQAEGKSIVSADFRSYVSARADAGHRGTP